LAPFIGIGNQGLWRVVGGTSVIHSGSN